MRIAISGCANSGKSTLVERFKQRWPMYSSPSKTYRDVIKENNLSHSSNTTGETQLLILDWMLTEMEKYPKGSHVIYDRCPWDNLAYTLKGNMDGTISDEVTAATISFVRESMKGLDIIFWLKYNPTIKIVADGLRDTKEEYIKSTDQIFSDLFDQYMENLDNDLFYPKEDCPAIIALDETFSTIDDRLNFIAEFLDPNGNLIETEESVLSLENLELFQNILGDQEKQKAADDRLNKIINELKK